MLHLSPPGQEQERRAFLWDNLGSHTHPIIHQTVEANYGHIINRRSAHGPADGHIEYVICQLADQLRNRYHIIRTLPELVNAINCIIGEVGGFNATFEHVGYKSNQ